MAKKKAARGRFNMSAEIRKLLEENPALNGRQVVDLLQERHPDQKINRNSANVAFSNARQKLGIRSAGKKAAPKTKPVKAVTRGPAKEMTINLTHLKAARKFIATVGSPEKAIEVIQQLQSLQLE